MPSGYVYTWTGKVSDNFGDVGNWYNDTIAGTATVAPGTSDEALITASGAINGPGAVFELGMTGTGTGLTIGGSLNGSYVFLGGTVTLAASASLGSGNLVDIGDYSSETIAQHVPTLVTVDTDATLFAADTTAGSLDILIGQDGNGTLAVNGTHATATAGPGGIWAGNGGLGIITVTNGGGVYGGGETAEYAGFIGLALGSNGGTGSLTIAGAGSVGAFGNIVDVGYGGTGVLDVSSGGSLIAGDMQTSLILGDSSTSGNGAVSISDASANLYGVVDDGSYGTGDFSVSNGGSVFLNTNASNGTAATYSILVGAQSGSSGTLSLSSGAQMTSYNAIVVGSYGTGSLSVTDATLTIVHNPGPGLAALAIGLGGASKGSAQISGGFVSAADVIVGGYGNGSLSIDADGSAGGTLLTSESGGDGVVIGSASGASGSVTIAGENALLKAASAIIVGAAGSGSLSVSAGGSLLVDNALTATSLIVGDDGGAGSFTVSGGFATIDGELVVGDGSSGALEMDTSGHLTVDASAEPAFVLGAQAGVSGSATIVSQAALSVTGEAVIGSDGSGTLTIETGADVSFYVGTGESSPGIVLGAGSGSSGTLSIQHGSLSSAAGIAVGSLGAGLLDLSYGDITITEPAGKGLNALSAGLSAGVSGIINILDGTIDDVDQAGVILGSSGSGSLTVSTNGTLLTGAASGSIGLALGLAAGASGTASVTGSGSEIIVAGTVLDGSNGTGGITVSGGATFSAGAAATATGLALGGVGGSGSFALSASTATILGQTQVGEYGAGTLSISGGSTFSGQTSGFAALVVASGSSSTGSLLITEAGTRVTLAGGLDVGAYGNAQATIQDGATVTAITWGGNGGPSVVIEAAQGSGTLNVTGAGTKLAATGEVQVGGTIGTGAGTLIISSGATVTTALASGQSIDGATIGGTSAGTRSVASVTGAGSVWSVAGILGIGESGGSALLTIGAGGLVSAGAVAVDTNGGAHQGTIIVSGAGATLTAGALTLGNGTSTGSLGISTEGVVSITGTTSVDGSVTLSEARLTTGVLSVAAGSSVIGNGNLSAGSITDLGRIGVMSGKLNCIGSITGSGSLTIGGKGQLELTHIEAKTVGVDFTSGAGQLYATTSQDIQGTIGNWSAGASIALKDQNVVSDSYSKGTLTLFGVNKTVLGTLHFSGSLTAGNFTLGHPASADTVISYHG